MPDTIINIDIEGIGPVCFNRSRRARRIIISVSPAKGVRVSVPLRISIGKAVDFVHLKQNWIRKHQAIIARVENRKQALGIHLQTIDKAAATKQLRDRLEFLAREHGFSCNLVTVRRQKTLWGSCSPRGALSFNWKLIMIPLPVVEYVVVHELCHLRELNHSKSFWTLVERHCPGWSAQRKWLRANESALTLLV